MFGKNEIVGRARFTDQSQLCVTSIFHTLQGEGPYSGKPAIFVRLAKCNLRCSFCDTYFDSGSFMAPDELSNQLDSMIALQGKIGLVITGGEPMLQSDVLVPWLNAQVKRGGWSFIQIETNGTQAAVTNLDYRIDVVVSPKATLDESRYPDLQPNVLIRANFLKFVLRAPSSLSDPYGEVPMWARRWNEQEFREVFVSPMNVYAREPAQAKAIRLVANEAFAIPDLHIRSTIDEVISFWEPGLLDLAAVQRNHEYAARYAIKHGLRFSMQQHLFAGLA